MSDGIEGVHGVDEQHEPPVCHCGTGYDGHLPTHAVHPHVDYQFRGYAKCRGCGARMAWWETPRGKMSPHDMDGKSHFGTCPVASRFRHDNRVAGAEKYPLCPATQEAVREMAPTCTLCGRPAGEHTSEKEVPHG